ncbi:MAG: UPF0175 family protein [Bryobacteraceae bacterium]
MTLTLEVPEEFARLMAADAGSLTRAAFEALALEGIRSGRLTVAQGREFLGISSRYEMDGFLKAHDVLLPLTMEDINRDAEAALLHRVKRPSSSQLRRNSVFHILLLLAFCRLPLGLDSRSA